MPRKLLYPLKHDGREFVPDVGPPMVWASDAQLSEDYLSGLATVRWHQNYYPSIRIYGNVTTGQMYLPIIEEE